MYEILHDNNMPFVLVGETAYHEHLAYHLNKIRNTICISKEDLQAKTKPWIDNHQFMCVVSNVKFKHQMKILMESLGCSFFSVVGSSSVVDDSCIIGQNVYINQQNYLFDNCKIQDFSTITHQCCLGHKVIVEHGVHISPKCYLNYTNLGCHSVIGAGTNICGSSGDPVIIAPKTNLMLGSTLTGSINVPGTYYGKKKVSNETSFTKKLF